MSVCAIVSFRLGLSDGVSVVAALWQEAIERLGWSTYTVAGEGPVDHLVPGLAIEPREPIDEQALRSKLTSVLARADVVLVENLLSIPLNLKASLALADVLTNRSALLHHHDPPWQRERFAHITELPPDDPQWRHVTINKLTQAEFGERGIEATTIYNGFEIDPPAGDRAKTRAMLGLSVDDRLIAHPVRAIARKNIPEAVALTERLGGVYWLPGPPEEGYASTLDAILSSAHCPVLRYPIDGEQLTMPDLYAASDLIAFPSTWEGFGNPPVEAAIHRRLAAVGNYPVALELRALGFQWFDPSETTAIDRAIDEPPTELLDQNRAVAIDNLSIEGMTNEVKSVFDRARW